MKKRRQQHAALAAAFYDLKASSALPISGAVRVERGNVALTASRPPASGRHHSLDILQRLLGVPVSVWRGAQVSFWASFMLESIFRMYVYINIYRERTSF